MNDKEARDEALSLVADILGMDEFQRLAVHDLMRDLDGFEWPPKPGSEHERKLMELGAIVSERLPL